MNSSSIVLQVIKKIYIRETSLVFVEKVEVLVPGIHHNHTFILVSDQCRIIQFELKLGLEVTLCFPCLLLFFTRNKVCIRPSD